MSFALLPSIGPAESVILLLMIPLLIWPCWRICSKAGFPGALGLLVMVPLANLLLLYLLAFAEWPALRGPTGAAPTDDLADHTR
ncbi:MAG: hypothetical protein ABI353_02475 [Isosphaeraceae bacterium]